MTTIENLLEAKGGRVYQIGPSASIAAAAREFIAHGVSSLVVAQQGRIVGLFTKNDLTRCCAERAGSLEETKVSEYMKEDVFTTTPAADLDEVVRTMIREGFHHVPVSEGGKPMGMITYGDILASERRRLQDEEQDLIEYIQGSH